MEFSVLFLKISVSFLAVSVIVYLVNWLYWRNEFKKQTIRHISELTEKIEHYARTWDNHDRKWATRFSEAGRPDYYPAPSYSRLDIVRRKIQKINSGTKGLDNRLELLWELVDKISVDKI